MPTKALRRTIDRLRQTLAPKDVADEQLLQRFIADRDEIAFAGLVRRHGSMVFGVCRRVLGNLHDSEDVFQATFLVLAEKARSVVNREALASWLYKVAYRIALKARTRNARRRQKEKQVDVMPHPATTAPAVQDWEALLDEELHRLPEKYRVPLILCDLEGRSGKEAERQLRLPPGTLSSRLSKARRMLAERLTRRGLTLAAVLTAAIAESAVPPAPSGATVNGAKLVAAGQLTAISSSVTTLMKIGAKAMFLAKLKATVATLMVVTVLGGGLVYSGSGGGQAKPKNELEALRRENELLKVNLRVTLEKIEALEKQLKDRKDDAAKRIYADSVIAAQRLADVAALQGERDARMAAFKSVTEARFREKARATRNAKIDAAINALVQARARQDSKEAREKALDAVEKMLKSLREAAPAKK